MAGGIGIAVVIAQGWLWLLPLFVFLLSGVLLGKLNRGAHTDDKHGKPRDAMQVFCSGGIYTATALLWFDSLNQVLMSISICVAMCDTWASEIGMYTSGRTWNIITFKKVRPGLSGGVSIAGMTGGFLGSMVMGMLCSSILWQGFDEEFFFGFVFVLIGAGMVGMLLDSLLGALLQAKYRNADGLSDTGTTYAGGVRWMTNDLVNLLSNAAMIAIAIALH